MADRASPHQNTRMDDAFSNFKFEPPRVHGHFRAFTRKSRFRNMATSRSNLGSKLGSSTSLASLTGSSQNLLDPAKMMSMQDSARSRNISTEVMKNRLYESVVTSPRRRRFSMRMDYSMPNASEMTSAQDYARMVQSLPVSPAHSQIVTPAHSPTSNQGYFFGFFSRGATPQCLTPEELDEEEMECDEDSWKGLASIFRPQPRYIPGSRHNLDQGDIDCEIDEETSNDLTLLPPPDHPGIILRTVPRARKRSKSPQNDEL